jgi:superfamily II DNA/RNA helicase
MSFSTLGLDPSLLENLTRLGYAEATPVQREAIPAVLAGGDLLVSSQTGSGKTAAFVLACSGCARPPRAGASARACWC